MSSGTSEPSDESPPAVITAPRSGTRTPRHVQWVSNDAVPVDGGLKTSPRESVHELDEMGVDPDAFETLRSALEKHRSREHLPHESVSQDGRKHSTPSILPQSVVSRRATTSALTTRHNPFTGPAPAFRLSSPFQPHVNSDNPYPRSAPQIQSESQGTGGSPPQQGSPSVDNGDFRLSSSTLVAQRTHDVPGEVWIDPLEREGLPVYAPIGNSGNRGEVGNILRRRSTWARRDRDDGAVLDEKHVERLAEYRAAGVVRAHTRRGWRWLHHPPNGRKAARSKGTDEGEKTVVSQVHSGTDEKGKVTEGIHHPRRHTRSGQENGTNSAEGELHLPGRVRKGVPRSWAVPAMHVPHTQRYNREERHHDSPHGPKLANGVLSALLALYGHDQDHDHDDDGSTSGSSTPRRSRTSSDAGSDEDNLPKPDRPWLSNQVVIHNDPSLKGSTDVKGDHIGKSVFGYSTKAASASSILAHLRTPSLPAAPTTAALIAGAGTLSGAAAPQQATLAPNLKKAGYNLVRYSVEEVPEGAGRVPSATSHGLHRARSMDSSLVTADHRTNKEKETDAGSPDTLGGTIVGSPTAGSDGLVDRQKEGRDHAVSTPEGRGHMGWSGRLKDLPLAMHLSPRVLSPALLGTHTPGGSGSATPGSASARATPVDEFGERKDYFDLKHVEKETRRIKEQERHKQKARQREKEKRLKRRKAEVYITKHVAEILQRQEFVMKLTRAMMMFGGPSHRLVSQIQSTGRVLDLELSCMYLPDVMLLSFEDSATGTSNIKFIRQGSALDLEKLGEAYALYWSVIHDNMSVSAASASLDVLMRKKPLYSFVQLTIVGGMCSASICSVSFSGSFIDCLASAPLGAILVAIQLIGVRNELYAHVFEITIATLLSFLSAALASTKHFCYSAVASSSVVLILPGFIVLSGSLELSSRSMVAGAVRLCFALMYSLFLGFGLAIGAELYQSIIGRSIIGPTDYTCEDSHDPAGPWWQQTPSLWWAFLTVPMYSLFLSMRLMAPWWKKEMILLIAVACIGWVTNHFVGTKFPNQSDISAAVGAFAVGFVSNMYGRFFNGNAFVVMITGILFQVPSGLGNGGLLNFVSDQTSGSSSSYTSGFHTTLQLISVAIGLTVGLGISLVLVHPIQSRRRAGGMFSL